MFVDDFAATLHAIGQDAGNAIQFDVYARRVTEATLQARTTPTAPFALLSVTSHEIAWTSGKTKRQYRVYADLTVQAQTPADMERVQAILRQHEWTAGGAPVRDREQHR